VGHRILLYCFILAIGGGMLGSAANRWFERSATISNCPGSTLSRSHGPLVPLHAQQVFVQPWKGRHQVYALFLVPGGYQADQFVTIKLADGQIYCGHTALVDPSTLNQSLPPGHYMMRGKLRTRTTIGLLSQGKKAELEQPTNWTLVTQKNWW
jgi:hypothetical protein